MGAQFEPYYVTKVIKILPFDDNTPMGYYRRMKPIVKKGVIRRLKIVEGQVRGLQRMIELDEYCIDVLHQTIAVKQALSGIEDAILQNHLATHVVEQIKAGKESQSTKEILEIYKLSKKK